MNILVFEWLIRPYLSFFFYSASNAIPDIGSVGLKKKILKKITRRLGIGGPGTPG